MAESRVGTQGKPKVNLEYTVQKGRKSWKTDGDISKGYRDQLERDSIGYIKNKFKNQYQ